MKYLHNNGVEDINFSTANADDMLKLIKHIEVGQRISNPKRDFLFINEYQGKHKPVQPSKVKKLASLMVDSLEVHKYFKKDMQKDATVVVISFAETALLLGELVSDELLIRHLAKSGIVQANTTRINKCDTAIQISEEHSHNSELFLNIPSEDIFIDHEPILIIDDEISTGNTVKNLIKNMGKVIDLTKHHIYCLSVMNWTGKHSDEVDGIQFDYISLIGAEVTFPKPKRVITNSIREVRASSWQAFYTEFGEQFKKFNSIGVIGVEEYMTDGFKLADKIETLNPEIKVTYQATTRSPIEVKGGIKHKSTITSPFKVINEKTNDSYIYNIEPKDAYIVTIPVFSKDTLYTNFFNQIGKILTNYAKEVYLVMIEHK
jgi:hypothetical protein